MNLRPLPTKGKEEYQHSNQRLRCSVLPWVVTSVLCITNVWTLVSDRTQAAAHDALVSVITKVFGGSIHSIPGPGHPDFTITVQSAGDLAKQNLMLVKRKKELESNLIKLQRENSEVKARTVEVDSRFQKLQAEHIDLRNKHVALETDQRALKEMSVKRAKAVKTVSERISRKLAIHAGELIGELPLRAAPYLGVFTLVTTTAIDIRSDCELTRTLNALVLEHQEAPLDTHAVCQYTDKIPAATDVWNRVKNQAGTVAVPVYQKVEKLYQR